MKIRKYQLAARMAVWSVAFETSFTILAKSVFEIYKNTYAFYVPPSILQLLCILLAVHFTLLPNYQNKSIAIIKQNELINFDRKTLFLFSWGIFWRMGCFSVVIDFIFELREQYFFPGTATITIATFFLIFFSSLWLLEKQYGKTKIVTQNNDIEQYRYTQ
jgi:hypothetical protein